MAVPGFDQAMQSITDNARRANVDLDETRRLLYMALVADRTKKYNLAGTIINALVHHHAAGGLTAAEVADHVVNVLEGVNAEAVSSSREWLQQQVDRITAELDG